MTQYDDTNKGVLFFEESPKSDKHPNWNGYLNIDGKEYWVSGWGRRKDGKAYISLSKGEERKPKEAQRSQNDNFDDDSDIPF